jgi:predicted phosphodiesterase
MRAAVFSDVHGNLPALETMLAHVRDVDRYICLGDMVNYGPWGNECVDLIFSLPNCTVVEGNHETYFLENAYAGSGIAKTFFDVCRPMFERSTLIAGLPKKIQLEDRTFVHTLEDRTIYPDTAVSLDANYVIGHSHHQFRTESKGYVLYGCGSVGQNRLYINVINYLVLQEGTREMEMHSIVYDEMLVINEMRRKKFPPECIDYYNSKQRLYGPRHFIRSL